MNSQNAPVLDTAARESKLRNVVRRPAHSARPTSANALKVGVIGYGYWGPNIVRNFHGLDNCEVMTVCDKSTSALKRANRAYPHVPVTTDFSEVLTSPEIDAVAVITPVWTHYELAKAALQNGKHVFVEKPFTSNSSQAE